MKIDVSNSRAIMYGDLVAITFDDELHHCLVIDLDLKVGLLDIEVSRVVDTYGSLARLNEAPNVELVAKSNQLTLTTFNIVKAKN